MPRRKYKPAPTSFFKVERGVDGNFTVTLTLKPSAAPSATDRIEEADRVDAATDTGAIPPASRAFYTNSHEDFPALPEPTPTPLPETASEPEPKAGSGAEPPPTSSAAGGKEEDWKDADWQEVYKALMEPTPEGTKTPDCLSNLGKFNDRGKFCPSSPFSEYTELVPPLTDDEMKLLGGHNFFGEK